MHIKGWVKSSLLDYPGRIAASLFCGGCNFRCPNCHNSGIVLHADDYADIPESELWAFLERRAGLLDGVVISGGEPTLQRDLIPFALRLHETGYLVKLDTNGYRPDVLQAMLNAGVVDYVAMDVKAPLLPDKYALAAGVSVDVTRIRRSIDLLRDARVAYEFRTTVVPGILVEDDILQIAKAIAAHKGHPGARRTRPTRMWGHIRADNVRYYLQQYLPRDTLDPEMMKRAPYPAERICALADLARQWVDHVEVRGI